MGDIIPGDKEMKYKIRYEWSALGSWKYEIYTKSHWYTGWNWLPGESKSTHEAAKQRVLSMIQDENQRILLENQIKAQEKDIEFFDSESIKNVN